MSLNTNFEIWNTLLTEAVPDRIISYEYSKALFETAAACYGTGQKYYARTALGDVDLTNLFDQYIMLKKLKGL